MTSPLAAAVLFGPALAFVLCTPPHDQRPIRTADITIRGLKASDFPRTRKLAENVYSYEQIDPTKRTITVNNLIVVTRDGVLVADSQGTVENTRRLVADIARLTPQPIKYVVVGSEHGDHTGGITAFPAGVTYFAHPFSAPRVKQPTEPVSDRKVLTLGGTAIEVRFLGRAHTGGDLEVYLPRENIVFMSEVFSNHVFPSMSNGYPTEWVATLNKAEALQARVYVPAHGFVDDPGILREELRDFRFAIERVIAEGRRLRALKMPLERAMLAADFGPYEEWTRKENNAPGALKRVYMELDGQLPPRQP
jgi:glyoxylase-like metal-dependent hydrolase (beta-lactamase superfamily II)